MTFLETLYDVAENAPCIVQTTPAVGGHTKDHYLVAYAVIGQADYLVTGG